MYSWPLQKVRLFSFISESEVSRQGMIAYKRSHLSLQRYLQPCASLLLQNATHSKRSLLVLFSYRAVKLPTLSDFISPGLFMLVSLKASNFQTLKGNGKVLKSAFFANITILIRWTDGKSASIAYSNQNYSATVSKLTFQAANTGKF